MIGDPKPGTFVFGFRSGVALARKMGTLRFNDDQPAPVVERGEMLVAAPAGVSAGRYAYARLSDGVIVDDADGGRNRLIGWWVTAPNADGVAQLHVDFRLGEWSRP